MCLFCQIPKESYVIENDLAYVLSDTAPKVKGHSLIIPKRHSENYFELEAEELAAIKELAVQMKKKLQAEDASIIGFNLITNVGEVAGQSVMHTHIHFLPRREDDGFENIL